MKARTVASTSRSAGITLTEILTSILILGVGLVSLATLFPIGLLRLREAQRQTRSAYLFESATADVAARGLLNSNSFLYADLLNSANTMWYPSPLNPNKSGRYDPLTQDTAQYGSDPYLPSTTAPGPGANNSFLGGGYGLPFAYDPLWRYYTVNPATGNQGVYPDPLNQITPEARFASGIYSLRGESDGFPASAHGLQRLTNFNTPALMPSASSVPFIFVSPEDVVWQESTNPNYWQAFTPPPPSPSSTPVGTPSSVIPDLSISLDSNGNHTYQPMTDWRFSWMLTVQQANGSNGAAFEGNIVVFENRQFAYDTTTNQAAGETVVEAVFGPGTTAVAAPNTGNPTSYYYAVGADRTVLLRWPAVTIAGIPNSPQSDPVVKAGDFIADVTYERAQNQVISRFYIGNNPAPPPLSGVQNPLNQLEWDNLPAQRCFWYQVQKVNPAQSDPVLGPNYRSMTVYVNQKLEAKTLLDANGNPIIQNAALICPNVVNVIPQTFFVR